MAGRGEGTADKLSNQIEVLKYVLLFFNAIVWMLGAAVFALTMWLRFEPGLEEWIKKLEIESFYIGTYVLIFAAIVMMLSAFIGCFSSFTENQIFIMMFIGSQVLSFILGLAGSAVILDYSTRSSRIQPMIRESMRRLIMNAHHEESRQTLAMIQENIGCCGADGAIDYSSLNQPIPSQCRDTVTGNPFFHGCVDELTWFFEEKTSWLTGLTMTICLMQVMNVVMSIVLVQAIKKEADAATTYKK